MKETEEKIRSSAEQKRKIRERYKGVDPDSLDVIPALPQEDFYSSETLKRVAVYARVSTDDPRQTSSYELQKNHYEDVVSRHPNWQLVNIYADEGISGTSLKHRDAFVQMIKDCEAGKIDIILTKSVSRFARNVIDCIGHVRALKALDPPVGVFFETENIYTLNANSEMSLSFISTLAQEESHNKSEIMNASIEMRFKRGIFLTPPLLGYDQDENGELIINPEEAKTVRLIFFMYLYGYSLQEIAGTLTELGCKTKRGNTNWQPASIVQILQNERHCGDVLARKTFTPNYLDHKSKKNRQDRNQYRSRDHHEAIISRDDFIAVQRKLGSYGGGNMNFRPSLSVVTDGLLKGFVLVSPGWAGFKAEDYINTSARFIQSEESPEITAYRGDFDLRGYEIVRGQFLNSFGNLSMDITEGKVRFSRRCYEKLGNSGGIEILLHPSRKLFAVRAASPDSRNRFRWLSTSGMPRAINCRSSLPALFELFGWNLSYQYRISGTFHANGRESVLFFDVRDTRTIIPKGMVPMNKEGYEELLSRKNGVLAYPGEWTESFGKEYYAHEYVPPVTGIRSAKAWKISSGGVAIGEEKIEPTDEDALRSEIARIVKEIKTDD